MRLVFLMTLTVSVLLLAQTQDAKSNTRQQTSAHDARIANNPPIVVNVLPTPKTQQESAQEAQDRKDKTENDRKLTKLTGDLVNATYVLAGIGVLQLIVFGYQAIQLTRTVNSAGEQSRAMTAISEKLPDLLTQWKGSPPSSKLAMLQ